jgi:glycosyltransferase involved in cell wall biosynthesis
VKFSLIIPSYNNANELSQELPGLISYLHDLHHEVEVVVVNDGSAEKSRLEEFCRSHAFRLIHHETNLGKGAAVRTGMLNATSDIRIFTDADIPFQYDVFPDILRMFEDTSVAMICGDRRQSDYFSQTPWVRRIGSGVFSSLVNVIMLRNLGDTQCGIKAFRKNAVEQIFPDTSLTGFAADIEWIYLAHKFRIPVKWVKAEFRNAGESSVVFWKQAMRMMLDVIRLRFRG